MVGWDFEVGMEKDIGGVLFFVACTLAVVVLACTCGSAAWVFTLGIFGEGLVFCFLWTR